MSIDTEITMANAIRAQQELLNTLSDCVKKVLNEQVKIYEHLVSLEEHNVNLLAEIRLLSRSVIYKDDVPDT